MFGIAVDDTTMAGALDAMESLIAAGGSGLVVTPNVQHVVLLQHDREFQRAYARASLVLPDSVPLVWASRLLGRPLASRVAGSDLLPEFAARASGKGYRLFLLGAAPGVARRAADILAARHPGLTVAGTLAPRFGFESDPAESERIAAAVRASSPDVVFLALGTPKGEIWAARHLDRLGAPLAACVGAAFDFLVGAQKRAPRWVQKIGFEWLYRLAYEPTRLWRRYILGNPYFLWLVVRFLVAPWSAPIAGGGRGVERQRPPASEA